MCIRDRYCLRLIPSDFSLLFTCRLGKSHLCAVKTGKGWSFPFPCFVKRKITIMYVQNSVLSLDSIQLGSRKQTIKFRKRSQLYTGLFKSVFFNVLHVERRGLWSLCQCSPLCFRNAINFRSDLIFLISYLYKFLS